MAKFAYAWSTGLIEFADAQEKVPGGTLLFADNVAHLTELDDEAFETFVSVKARHGHKGELLVPGVPEADDPMTAVDAAYSWIEWAVPDAMPIMVLEGVS